MLIILLIDQWILLCVTHLKILKNIFSAIFIYLKDLNPFYLLFVFDVIGIKHIQFTTIMWQKALQLFINQFAFFLF